MKVSPISRPLPGEHVVGVEPQLSPDMDLGWNRRLRLYTGRALSDTALKAEQASRSGRLATRGQAVSPGVISGLEIDLEYTPDGQALYQLAAGLGIALSGEDVVVPTLMRVHIYDTRVVAPADILQGVPPIGTQPSGFAPYDRDVGPTLSTFVDSSLPVPHVGILLLQSVVAEMVGRYDDSDPCERDPQNDAYEDWQLVDGCRLLYYSWPTEFLILPNLIEPENPSTDQHRQALGVWRNTIAYTIFQEEANYGPDQFLPWMEFGVPVGLVAFDEAWKPLFIDNYAVKRSGGKPKLRNGFLNEAGGIDLGHDFSGLIPFSGNPYLWQARIQQFSEQVAEELQPGQSFDDLAGHFAFLPPAGLMPREMLHFYNTQEARDRSLSTRLGLGQLFPTYYQVQAVPVPLEQLDIPLEASASLAPFNLSGLEQVCLLVPVPQTYFEPGLLRIEEPDSEFQQNIDLMTVRRNKWLARRQDVRLKATLLYECATGEPFSFPALDPGATADEQVDPDPLDPGDAQLSISEIPYGLQTLSGAPVANVTSLDNVVVGIFEYLRTNLALALPFSRLYTAALDTVSSMLLAEIAKITNRLSFDPAKKLLSLTGPLDNRLSDRLTALANPDADKNFLGALAEIRKNSADNELLQLDTLGVEKFISLLDAKVRSANDKVDLGFVRVQTDIYRVRQLVLGNTNASRLATSPALATIAQGESAVATRQNIQDFLDGIKDTTIPPVAAPAGAAPASAPAVAASGAAPQGLMAGLNLSGISFAQPVSKLGSLSSVDSVLTNKLDNSALSAASASFADLAGAGELSTGINVVKPSVVGTTPIDIIGQSPVLGASNLRTITIAERLQAPKAPEAKLFSVSTKHDVINDMKSSGLYLDDIQIPGLAVRDAANVVQYDAAGQPVRKSVSLGDLKPQDILDEPHPEKEDESAYFVGTVELLDHSISFLRSIEARIQAYRQAITACQKVLNSLRDLFRQANQRLQTISDELAETRHDLSVAKTLLADEITRVNGINDRRDQVILDVKFLAFQRPRLAELRLDLPARVLDPGLTDPSVPACLNSSETPPDNLRAMVDLFRHVPVRWLTHVMPFLDRLSTLPLLTNSLQNANLRAVAQLASNSNPVLQQVTPPQPQSLAISLFNNAAPRQNMGKAIQNVFSTQQQAVMQTRQAIAQFDFAQSAGQSWQNVREIAADRLSLGDLIDSNHNLLDVSRGVARELDQISHVAACLYEGFDDVLPVLRLGWAELLSQYDAPINLRNLASLPRWSEVPFLERRSIQEKVDWLYNRIDLSQSQVVALMNDLVRVCILTASHAPVNSIISGHVPRPSRATIGERLDLGSLEISKVRIGMQVLVYQLNQVVAQGVVEDLSEGRVAVRVLSVQAASANSQPARSVAVEAGAQVHFVEKIYQVSKVF